MSDNFLDFDNKTISTSGFFGALTFTAMVLLMQFPEEIEYSEILIPWTALVSFCFIIVTMGIMNADVEKSHPNIFRYLIVVCFLVGYYGLIFLIPFLVLSFSVIGFAIILTLEVIAVIIFNMSISVKSKKKN